jgi:hypothetical protein
MNPPTARVQLALLTAGLISDQVGKYSIIMSGSADLA